MSAMNFFITDGHRSNHHRHGCSKPCVHVLVTGTRTGTVSGCKHVCFCVACVRLCVFVLASDLLNQWLQKCSFVAVQSKCE